MRNVVPLLCLVALSACQSSLQGPSLATRPAESIDPRLPVGSPDPAPGPLTIADELSALAAKLAEAGDTFERVPLASFPSGGAAAGSERWVAAQEIIAKLERANEPALLVLADVDALITRQIETQGWATPSDRDAALVLRDDARQTVAMQIDRIETLSARLGR